VQKSVCSGCGKSIVWAESDNGPIPLDPAPAVYELVEQPMQAPFARRRKDMLVLHFVTCSAAPQFSNRKGAQDGSLRSPRM
jgi:hypothetical protein